MMRYWSQEPWGPYRDNVHAAQLCALLANINRKKSTPAFSHEDFMLISAEERAQKRRRGVLDFFRNLARKKPDDKS